MTSVAAVAIRHPVFSWLSMIAICALGIGAALKLGISQNPDVEFPTLSVRTNFEGAAPEVVEKDVVVPIEASIATVSGVRHVRSVARQGSADVSIEFDLATNIDVALQEVQSALSSARRNLPEGIEDPIIRKSTTDDRPIVWFSVVSTQMSVKELMEFVGTELKDQFTTLPGVSEVILGGYVEPALRVDVAAERLNQFALTSSDVVSAIQNSHIEVPAGRIESSEREETLRVVGEVNSASELERITIKKRGGVANYLPVTLSEVADVYEGLAPVRRISRVSGESAVGFGIKKQRGANTIKVVQAAKKKVSELSLILPKSVRMGVTFDTTPFIEDSIKELLFTLILSVILTALICWLFLGSISATLNVLLSVPVSIFGTLAVIYWLGFTLNFFTLLAIILSVGLVVDDAIIVIENIFRHRNLGRSQVEAASWGATEIFFAVLATTLAIVAIFAPISAMKGLLGKFLFEFAVTICVAVLFSLFEAVVFTPMRCSQMVGSYKEFDWFHKLFSHLTKLYERALKTVLAHPAKVIIGSFLFLAFCIPLFVRLPKEMVPPQDESRIFVRIKTKLGSSLAFTDQKVRQVEKLIHQNENVVRSFVAVGGFGGEESNGATVFVTLRNPSDRTIDPSTQRPYKLATIAAAFREQFNSLNGVRAFIQESTGSLFGSLQGFPVEFSVRGPQWEILGEEVTKMIKAMELSGKFTDIRSDDVTGAIENQLLPDRDQAQRLGVEISDIAQVVQTLFAGRRVGSYTKNGQRYDLRVQLKSDQRDSIEDLEKIFVRNNRGELIALRRLIRIENRPASPTIVREDRIRSVTITANPAPGTSQKEALDQVLELGRQVLKADYRASLSGSSSTMQESFNDLLEILLLGLFVSYLVLASQFNSYLDPLIVFVALPFAFLGALIALWIGGFSINIYSMIGLVLLMGLVKKNSILLVEFANQLRDQGVPKREAILKACPIRLRPIVMTSVATFAAALPAAFNLGPGAESRIPMAVVVMGGIFISTLFSLFLVPCLYNLISRERRKLAL